MLYLLNPPTAKFVLLSASFTLKAWVLQKSIANYVVYSQNEMSEGTVR
jgi:hypothetical protein